MRLLSIIFHIAKFTSSLIIFLKKTRKLRNYQGPLYTLMSCYCDAYGRVQIIPFEDPNESVKKLHNYAAAATLQWRMSA
jgi:hypothetical protein